MDQMAIFNISEMENYHLLQIDFMNVPFTDLKFKIFLEEFINIGDKVKVDTRTGDYKERLK